MVHLSWQFLQSADVIKSMMQTAQQPLQSDVSKRRSENDDEHIEQHSIQDPGCEQREQSGISTMSNLGSAVHTQHC